MLKKKKKKRLDASFKKINPKLRVTNNFRGIIKAKDLPEPCDAKCI